MPGKLLLDSADLADINRVIGSDAIAGVTTNPSLMAKTSRHGRSYEECLEPIVDAIKKNTAVGSRHLSVEVITLDPEKMKTDAVSLFERLKRQCGDKVDLYIKIPVTVDNLSVISWLERRQVRVNATACMQASQARLALDAGASIVSFFFNRMKDGKDPDPASQITMTSLYLLSKKPDPILQKNPHYLSDFYKGGIICGSIRQAKDVWDCWTAGADYVTAGMNVIEQMMVHPQTDKAIEGFQGDIERWLESK